MESMETAKQKLKYASIKILHDHLGPEVMKTLTGLITIEGFSAITLGDLVSRYEEQPAGPKSFSLEDIQKINSGSSKSTVFEFIRKNPGCAMIAIVDGLSLRYSLVSGIVKKLRDSGKVTMLGERKGATYIVVDK